VTDVVQPGGTVHTDGWPAYATVGQQGYEHERTVMRQQSDPAHVVMPGVHRIASLLKRWLLRTHQGSVSSEHLDAYLNEFTFRFNRRTSQRRGLLFYRLLEQAVVTAPVPGHLSRPDRQPAPWWAPACSSIALPRARVCRTAVARSSARGHLI